MKTYIRWTVRKFWGLLAALILLTAVIVQAGRLMAPMVGDYKDEIESYFSTTLGATLSSDSLSFNWNGLLPELKFSKLALTSPDGRVVLTVDQAVAQIDFLSSLYSLSPKIWQLHLAQVQASLTQEEDGSWFFVRPGGEDRPATGSAGVSPLASLLRAREVSLKDIAIDYRFHNGRQHRLLLSDMNLENQQGFHRLAANLDLPDNENAVVLLVEGEGNINHWKGFDGKAYLEINDYQLRDSVAIASETISLWEGVRNTQVAAKIWVEFNSGDPLIVRGSVDAKRPEGGSYAALPSDVQAGLWGYFKSLSDWQLQLQSLTFSNSMVADGNVAQAQPLDVVFGQSRKDLFNLYLPQLDVGYWSDFVIRSGLLAEKNLKIIETLSPSGYLDNLFVDIPVPSPGEFQAYGNLRDVAAESWQGAPKVAGVDGYIALKKQWGVVEIDSQDHFMMHYPSVYHTPFEFDRAKGAVAWSFDKEINQIFVNSGLLSFEGELGRVNGYFALDTPYFKNTRPSDMVLQIGLRDSLAQNQELLVPYVSPESLRTWLNQSIVAGEVPEAGFFYRGSINKDSKDRTLQLGLKVAGAELDYSPGWPSVKQFDGSVMVDDQRLEGVVTQGRLLGSAMSEVAVVMDHNPQGSGSLLHIDGHLNGPSQDILSVLTQSPLRKQLGSNFDSWRLNGAMSADLSLGIPLKFTEPGLTQNIKVKLQDNSLLLGDLNLQVDGLVGQLSYSDSEGLHSPGLLGSLWGQPLVAAIATRKDGKRLDTRIDLKSHVDMARLETWSGRPELGFVQGDVGIVGQLDFALAGRAANEAALRMQFKSDLLGAEVLLPEPLSKPATEAGDLSFGLQLHADKTRYQLGYREQVKGELISGKGRELVGEVAVMAPLTRFSAAELQSAAEPQRGLWVTGALPSLAKQDLFDLIERYQQRSELVARRRQAEPRQLNDLSAGAPLLKFDAAVERLRWDDFTLEDVAVSGGQTNTGWTFALANELARGRITLASESDPLNVDLDYLKLPSYGELQGDAVSAKAVPKDAAQAANQSDFLESLNIEGLEPATISVAQVSLGAEDFGRWSFEVQPGDQQLTLANITGHIRGVDVQGASAGTDGASLTWQRGGDAGRSTFNGKLVIRDMGAVLERWQQPRLLESDEATLVANLSWGGSPVAMSLLGLSGDVALRADDGRFHRSSVNAESALLRLVGLFNFDSWVRRLQLDFSDVYKSGLAYDKIRGQVSFNDGMLLMVSPIKVETPSSELQMGGEINLKDETLDTTLVATLPVGGNITTATAFVAGLPAAAGVYLISKLLDKQIKKLTSVSYEMKGGWSDPEVKFKKLFDEKGAKDAGKKVQQSAVQPPVEFKPAA